MLGKPDAGSLRKAYDPTWTTSVGFVDGGPDTDGSARRVRGAWTAGRDAE